MTDELLYTITTNQCSIYKALVAVAWINAVGFGLLLWKVW